MSRPLADALQPLLPHSNTGVIALVGGGGKTRTLFALADTWAAEGCDVLLTTTTHIADPRQESGRRFDTVCIDPRYGNHVAPLTPLLPADFPLPPAHYGRRIVLAAGEAEEAGKLKGIAPEQITTLRHGWPLILVEADGAKHRPTKAPAAHEPVLPAVTDLVIGVIGLSCLGRPMNGDTVHRPEFFGPLTGCAAEAPIRLEHLAVLANAPNGLFKRVLPHARRVVLLNQADTCTLDPTALAHQFHALAPVCADLILVASWGATLGAEPSNGLLLAQLSTDRLSAMAITSSSGDT